MKVFGRVDQFDTSLGSQVTVNVGGEATGSLMYPGAFDNRYFSSVDGTGFLYVCGKTSGKDQPHDSQQLQHPDIPRFTLTF